MKKRSAVICAAACVLGLTACGNDLGDKMATAALNTVIGICTVFTVLVIIIGVISLFRFIPMIQDKLTRKKGAAQESAGSAATQIVQAEEVTGVSDDLELIAVIAAAVAASEGAASTDGFVVRSIRKINRAGRA